MTVLFLSESDSAAKWTAALAAALPEETVGSGLAPADPGQVEFAVVWKPPSGLLAALPHLKVIFSIGAGVDHVFEDAGLPANVPIVRLVDPALTAQMAEYVVMNVLWHHRRMPDYGRLQAEGCWKRLEVPRTEKRRVGIMGLGVLGRAAGDAIAAFGFPVAAWTRTPREWRRGRVFAGAETFGAFLAETDILACLLPLTPETQGILNAGTFARLPEGASLVNVARGGHVVVADLITALDSGQLSSATLDVFEEEPLPPHHPYWSHPRIIITPHVASVTYATSAAQQIAANIRRFRAGKPMIGVVDSQHRY